MHLVVWERSLWVDPIFLAVVLFLGANRHTGNQPHSVGRAYVILCCLYGCSADDAYAYPRGVASISKPLVTLEGSDVCNATIECMP